VLTVRAQLKINHLCTHLTMSKSYISAQELDMQPILAQVRSIVVTLVKYVSCLRDAVYRDPSHLHRYS